MFLFIPPVSAVVLVKKRDFFPSVSERSFHFLPRELEYDTSGIPPAKPHWEGETATVHATVAVGWG